jgi:hypothetical protein
MLTKEKLREIVNTELSVEYLIMMYPEMIKDIEDSLVEALHQALSMSGVVESAVDCSKPLKQCMAGRDGECDHPNCPVSDDDVKNGIFCHLPLIDWRE